MTTSPGGPSRSPSHRVSSPMWAAVVFGSLHTLVTVHWMLGGRWLIETHRYRCGAGAAQR